MHSFDNVRRNTEYMCQERVDRYREYNFPLHLVLPKSLSLFVPCCRPRHCLVSSLVFHAFRVFPIYDIFVQAIRAIPLNHRNILMAHRTYKIHVVYRVQIVHVCYDIGSG